MLAKILVGLGFLVLLFAVLNSFTTISSPPQQFEVMGNPDTNTNPFGMEVHLFQDLDYNKAHIQILFQKSIPTNISVRDHSGQDRILLWFEVAHTHGLQRTFQWVRPGEVLDFQLSNLFILGPKPDAQELSLVIHALGLGNQGIGVVDGCVIRFYRSEPRPKTKMAFEERTPATALGFPFFISILSV